MKIVIGADHRGYQYKQSIQHHAAFNHIEWIDVGAFSEERSDYPDFACACAKKIQKKEVTLGILLCGTGIGMSIAANRFNGIFAGLSWNVIVAREAKEDDNINVLVLPADFISLDEAFAITTIWLTARFKGGHYQDRIDEINHIIDGD